MGLKISRKGSNAEGAAGSAHAACPWQPLGFSQTWRIQQVYCKANSTRTSLWSQLAGYGHVHQIRHSKTSKKLLQKASNLQDKVTTCSPKMDIISENKRYFMQLLLSFLCKKLLAPPKVSNFTGIPPLFFAGYGTMWPNPYQGDFLAVFYHLVWEFWHSFGTLGSPQMFYTAAGPSCLPKYLSDPGLSKMPLSGAEQSWEHEVLLLLHTVSLPGRRRSCGSCSIPVKSTLHCILRGGLFSPSVRGFMGFQEAEAVVALR